MNEWFQANRPVADVVLATLVVLALGSIARWITVRSLPRDQRIQRTASLKTWWILAIVVFGAAFAGRAALVVVLGTAAWLALHEFGSIALPGLALRYRRIWVTLMVLAGFGTIVWPHDGAFLAVVPLVAVWTLVLPHVLGDTARSYLEHVGHALWGIMIWVWGLGHAAWLLFLPAESSSPQAIGVFLLLLLVTELNDITQALVGRRWGRFHILPKVSPGKTWEGFIGGLTASVVAVSIAGPWLLPLDESNASMILQEAWRTAGWYAVTGAVIACSGFVGDLNMSCIKRDAGVKDGSSLLPGQGGIVDRIDSLSFTAPAFVYWILWTTDGWANAFSG